MTCLKDETASETVLRPRSDSFFGHSEPFFFSHSEPQSGEESLRLLRKRNYELAVTEKEGEKRGLQ